MNNDHSDDVPRILIVDDNDAIHNDFRLILASEDKVEPASDVRQKLFGLAHRTAPRRVAYELDYAFQGQDAFHLVQEACQRDHRYSVAFVDMRMPPGWDGLETIKRIHTEDETIQLVMCTAYSDYSWQEIRDVLGDTDRLLILKKPFDNAEVSQLAAALCQKHQLAQIAAMRTQELEQKVEARTQEIIALSQQKAQMQSEAMQRERQLLQKQKLESLGMLAGGVAHDVNNLLHVVQNYVAMAHKTFARDTAASEYIRNAQEAIAEMATIVRRILDYSRRQPDDLQQINVADAILRAEQLIRPLVEKSNHQLSVVSRLPEVGVSLESEKSLIEQTLVNLCTNACDAMLEPGQISIVASCVRFDQKDATPHAHLSDGHYLQIEVTDQGTGIPPEVQKQILDPFFTTKTEGRGTGLGLATIDGAIRRHNGSLEIESTVGEGSTFRFLLPTAVGETREAECERPAQQPETSSRAGGGVKILVADDAAAIREIARLALEDVGFVPIIAEDGRQAVELAQKHPDIAVLVLDVQMPLLNGHEVAAAVDSASRNLPVIFCSGYDASQHLDAEQTVVEANSVFLDKPFAVDKLLEAIHEVLDDRSGQVPEPGNQM